MAKINNNERIAKTQELHHFAFRFVVFESNLIVSIYLLFICIFFQINFVDIKTNLYAVPAKNVCTPAGVRILA